MYIERLRLVRRLLPWQADCRFANPSLARCRRSGYINAAMSPAAPSEPGNQGIANSSIGKFDVTTRGRSEHEFDVWQSRIIRTIQPRRGIFQRRLFRRRNKESLVEERYFRGHWEAGRCHSRQIVAVDVDDVEFPPDLLDQGNEAFGQNIDFVEFDGEGDNISGTIDQSVE